MFAVKASVVVECEVFWNGVLMQQRRIINPVYLSVVLLHVQEAFLGKQIGEQPTQIPRIENRKIIRLLIQFKDSRFSLLIVSVTLQVVKGKGSGLIALPN